MERFTRNYAYSPFEWNVLLEITLTVPLNGTFTRNYAYSPFKWNVLLEITSTVPLL